MMGCESLLTTGEMGGIFLLTVVFTACVIAVICTWKAMK